MVYKDLLQRPPEGNFHIKMTGVLIRNFEKKRYQDPVLWAWPEFFFTPERY